MSKETVGATAEAWPGQGGVPRWLGRARALSYGSRIGVILSATAAVLVIAYFLPAIPQDPSYHDFADRRAFMGIPNFGDVASNAPFLLASVLGLVYLAKRSREPNRGADPLRLPFLVYFVGVGMVAFGSAYYHYNPTNETLFWDRLPMTIAFMALLSAFVADRIDEKAGRLLLPFLVVLGIVSVVYWLVTEQAGQGDLRFYGVVQFFPMLAIPLIFVLFPPQRLDARYAVGMFVFYALAKVFEFFDHGIFELLGQGVSGHSLKHLSAAVASYLALPMLREPVEGRS